jgi:hypothetical protein
MWNCGDADDVVSVCRTKVDKYCNFQALRRIAFIADAVVVII